MQDNSNSTQDVDHASLLNMTTEQILAVYAARRSNSSSTETAAAKPVEYQKDYMRRAAEIDNDTRLSEAQKIKSKVLLSKAALSRPRIK